MKRELLAFFVAFFVSSLTACAVVRPMTASNADLVDHRAFVLERTEGARLARASRYLEKHPQGAWAADVRAAFDAEEPAYYRACTSSRSRAIDYIAWLPRGPHADAAFALVRSEDEHEPEDEASRMVKAANENETRLERAAQARSEATEAALSALHAVIADVYGKSLDDAHELTRFLLGGMNFGATPLHRTRLAHFDVPSRQGPIERTLEITVDVTRDGDRVASAVVSGPALFVRIAEAALVHEPTPEEAERYVRDAITAMARGLDLRIDIHVAQSASLPDTIRIAGK